MTRFSTARGCNDRDYFLCMSVICRLVEGWGVCWEISQRGRQLFRWNFFSFLLRNSSLLISLLYVGRIDRIISGRLISPLRVKRSCVFDAALSSKYVAGREVFREFLFEKEKQRKNGFL